MTTKDNQFALELFVANHNANSEDQLEIINDILYIPKTVAILATTNGKIEQYIDFEKPLQPQTLWFIANRKVYRHLNKDYQNQMTITDNGFSVAVKNNRIFLKPIDTKDIHVTVELNNTRHLNKSFSNLMASKLLLKIQIKTTNQKLPNIAQKKQPMMT